MTITGSSVFPNPCKIGGYGGALVGGTAAYASSKAYAKMVSDLAAKFGASAAGGAQASDRLAAMGSPGRGVENFHEFSNE